MEETRSPPQTLSAVRRRNKKGSACTHCRQLKLKCDAAETSPSACTRCVKVGRQCSIDPTFRRTANKERLDSLEKELQHMRNELKMKHTTPSSPSPPLHSNGGPDIAIGSQAPVIEVPIALPGHSNQVVSEMIDEVELPPNVILKLIHEYFEHFHTYFPILPDLATFLTRYNSNKLLLWSVLAIASRESRDFPSLYPTLVDPVRRLAADLYASQSRSFETVQALLLLCVWPFPFQQTINDPSPMYVGLATQIAYQLGLHRPSRRADFAEGRIPQSDPGDFAVKKVWFGCCIVNQAVTSKLGTPSTIRPGFAVLSEIAEGRSSIIPEPLISQLHIAHLSNKAFQALGDYEYSASGALPDCLTTVKSFESEFNETFERFKNSWSPHSEIFYQAQLLHLYSFGLDSGTMTSQTARADVSVNSIYGRACNAVLRLINLVQTSSQSSNYWPAFVKYSLVYCLFIAIPLANLEDHGSDQRNDMIQAIRTGNVLMKSWSMFDRDHFSRVSSHVDYLLRALEKADRGQVPTPPTIAGHATAATREGGKRKRLDLSVKSRMAANVMYETIWAGKHAALDEEQARQRRVAAPPPVTTPNGGLVKQPAIAVPPADGLQFNDFNPTFDEFAFADGWGNSGFLDILADWQSLLGNE